jgi:hypothetical protein
MYCTSDDVDGVSLLSVGPLEVPLPLDAGVGGEGQEQPGQDWMPAVAGVQEGEVGEGAV